MKNTTHKDLCSHIARVEGQLAAVRAALSKNDCSKASKTLLAASRSLESARAACVTTFLSEAVYKGSRVADAKLLADVHSLIKA